MLAFHRDRVVGFALVHCPQLSRLKGIGDFLIYVHRNYQKQGLGTFLTNAILEEAKKEGLHRIWLEVVTDNLPAVRCYEKCGFVREDAMRDAYFGDDGTYHDMLIMARILSR